jgi:Na+/melibiose symporter-like transporter
MLGPLLSTSVILPTFGGWRQVLVFYGVISITFGLLWLLLHPAEQTGSETHTQRLSLGQSLRHVMRLRNVWILGISGLGIMACFQGFTGYLPTYLKAIGWADLDADRALSAFFVTSLIGVVPLSILSDRLRIRRGFLIAGAVILGTGIGSLSVIDSRMVLILVAATGLVFDAYMAIYNASVLEVEGVGYLYAGTALGFSTMIRSLGGTLSPPLGNSLAVYGPSVPILFWGGLGLFAAFMYAFVLKMPRAKLHAG